MRFRNALSIIDLSPCRVQGDVMDGMDGIDGMLLIKAFSQSFILARTTGYDSSRTIMMRAALQRMQNQTR